MGWAQACLGERGAVELVGRMEQYHVDVPCGSAHNIVGIMSPQVEYRAIVVGLTGAMFHLGLPRGSVEEVVGWPLTHGPCRGRRRLCNGIGGAGCGAPVGVEAPSGFARVPSLTTVS